MVKKKALLVGCNYSGKDQLRGCIKDARNMSLLLKDKFGFNGDNIDILVDENPDTSKPTHANIDRYMKKLTDGAQSGDILVFYFSGHGGLQEIPRSKPNDNTGWREQVYPNDLNYPVTDAQFRDIVSKIPEGVKFTFISDSCSSGGLIADLKEQVGGGQMDERYVDQYITCFGKRPELAKRLDMPFQGIRTKEKANEAIKYLQQRAKTPPRGEGDTVPILLSGCESWEYSSDTTGGGLFTSTITTLVEARFNASPRSPYTNLELIKEARLKVSNKAKELDKESKQHPCLYCNDANAERVFICDFVRR